MGVDTVAIQVYQRRMVSFRSIIERWPSAEKFGADLGLKYPSHARVMKVRNSIPASYWPRVLEAAGIRRIDLTRADLDAAKKARDQL